MVRWPIWIMLFALSTANPLNSEAPSTAQEHETDSPQTRKLLGSSVVTSVSVIMDHGNGTKTYITDGGSHSGDTTSGQLGRPPQVVGTPGTLLAPDRYEFYTFGKEGELVKKLMTLDQIQSLIAAAGGEDEDDLSDQPVYYHQPLVEAGDSEGVSKVLESVHNVLKGELEAAAAAGQHSGEVPLLPDQSWTILLPGLLNNDMDLKEPLQPTMPKKPTTTTRPPPSSTVKSPQATTRFPPRRTTTAAPISTSYQKLDHTIPANRYTTTPRIPINQQQTNHQQQLASSSILTPQFATIKAPTHKPITSTTAGISTTVKYSAHYTTPHPTLPTKQTTYYVKPQNSGVNSKPLGTPYKKPVSSPLTATKSTTMVPLTTSTTTTALPEITVPITTTNQPSSSSTTTTTTKKPTTAPPITTYKASTTKPLTTHSGTKYSIINNLIHRNTTASYKPTTYKPTTYKPITARPQPIKYTENQRPSGIPTIVHYLPLHSISPSHAPVHTTVTTSKQPVSVTQKVTTTHRPTTIMSTTSTTTTTSIPTAVTNYEEPTTILPVKESHESTTETAHTIYPSTASVATKNHYMIINAVKTQPTTATPMKSPQVTDKTKYQPSSTQETHTSQTPLIGETSALPMQTMVDEDEGETVSVVTIHEDTTRPIEIITTTGIHPTTGSADKLVQTTSTTNKLEKITTTSIATTTTTTSRPSSRPSTVMVQVATRPPYHNNATLSTSTKNGQTRPTSSRPPVVHRRTTTTAAPPRRGSVTYTPLPQVYKTTPTPVRQPIKTSAPHSSNPSYTKTTVRPSATTVNHINTAQRRPPTTTTTTTQKPTTPNSINLESTTTTKPTESSTAKLPLETTTNFLTKMPLEQIPLKLYENLKNTQKPTIYEFPSTLTGENFNTMQTQESSTLTMNTAETIDAETSYATVPATLTTFPNRVVIVNNSEPFIMKQSISEEKLSPAATNEEIPSLFDSTDGNNLENGLSTLIYSTNTLPSTVEISTTAVETTTEPLTTFKDQILEEGINAVTSILLDGDQKKEFLLNMTKPLGLFNNTFMTTTTTSTTTEEEQQNTTTTGVTEETTTETLPPLSEEKSETRLDEIELTERYEEATYTTEMSTIKTEEEADDNDTTVKIPEENESHNQVKKHIQENVKNTVKEGATKVSEKKGSQKDEHHEVKATEQPETSKQEKEKINGPQNDEPQPNNNGSSEKLASPNDPKKPTNTKPLLHENIKKPTQQEIKKQSSDEQKRPISNNKQKPTNQKAAQDKISSNSSSSETEREEPAKVLVKLEIKNQTSEDPKKPSQVIVPTKESKLNPDIVNEPSQSVDNPLQGSSNSVAATVAIMTTERAIVHEQIKLQEADKTSSTHSKFNSKRPAYQPPPQELTAPPAAIDLHPAPYESMGLEASTAFLAEDVRRFADLCNELAFKLWTALTSKGQISSRSLVMSPFAVTSLLAMVFLGARGATSGQMNDILRLDDMVTFNPHQVLQNVTESVLNSKNKGVATAAFVRQLYSDKSKGKLLDFYKERAQQYYQGHVEEINFSTVGDIIRRRTNLLIKRQTLGKVAEYLRGSSLNMKPPLAAFSANIFQTDCELGSTEGRDGEMYFVVRPSTRQRRLVPVPAVVWRQGFLAGYEPGLDATSVCLGPDSVVSTILILPGQQGQVAPGDGLARLEQRLIETSYRRGAWSRLLRSQLPRPGLELQVPRFSHRSVLNVTGALTRMGLRDLFGKKADLRGLNGLSNDLHLSDMVQVNTFSTCGEETVGARHHIETYPASPQRTGRDDPTDNPSPSLADMLHDYSHNMQQWDSIPLALRPRQARLPDNPRLRFDRPFLYVVRHNPSGIILHMGRFNPRLLP